MQLHPIGHIESPYLTKFGVPRQPGLANAVESRLVLNRTWTALDELELPEPGETLVVLWAFSHNRRDAGHWTKTVRPPLLGGTSRVGVFASRSSFRPNALALSCVRLNARENGEIVFSGGDMADGTPVYGLYPYIEERHCHPEANEGWRETASWPVVERILIPSAIAKSIPAAEREGLYQVLRQDPRPAHTREASEGRIFWIAFGSLVVWFTVSGRTLRIVDARIASEVEKAHVRQTGNVPDDSAVPQPR